MIKKVVHDIKDRNIRVDDLQRNELKIIQNPKLYTFTMDAVLLAHYATVKKNYNIVDLGTGTGVIPLIISTRADINKILAVEIQEQLFELTLKSVNLNKLNNVIKVINEDVREGLPSIAKNRYDLVTLNPPYLKYDSNIKKTSKNIGRSELCGNLEDFISLAAKLLKVGGRLAMVQSSHRLADTIAILKKYNLEPKRFRMVQSTTVKEPGIFLLETIKGAKAGLKVGPVLIIYNELNEYTKEVANIYYGKGGLL
ncbi:tRNA1(Val) (adenine(37)-N6)-methyltransferase [Proteinivorax tanatarense]|uniref:tRNA1(Val) (Adenine(37)-N6)-methyltransferase n=1 Tax=Proteinivorax tanatarense TaxID=1260629 RepID=A0AAU7VLM4_9FIRM